MRRLDLVELTVNPTSDLYRRGFQAGFVARPDARPPTDTRLAYRVGFIHGRDGVRVPEELMPWPSES